jgi:hypothetical protein
LEGRPADYKRKSDAGLVPRKWNTSPPIVVVVSIVAIAAAPIAVTTRITVVSEAVDVADVAELLLDL